MGQDISTMEESNHEADRIDELPVDPMAYYYLRLHAHRDFYEASAGQGRSGHRQGQHFAASKLIISYAEFIMANVNSFTA